MSKEYRAPCGCLVHVIQWTSKAKMASVKNCPLHKAAPDLLQLCRESKYLFSKIESATDERELLAIEGFSARLEAFIKKAEEGDAA